MPFTDLLVRELRPTPTCDLIANKHQFALGRKICACGRVDAEQAWKQARRAVSPNRTRHLSKPALPYEATRNKTRPYTAPRPVVFYRAPRRVERKG